MCLVFVCDEKQKVISRKIVPGICQYCESWVQTTDIQRQWRFCFVPLYWKTKRKIYCTNCTRELDMK